MDGIMNIVYAILVLGVMGAVFGGLLAFAAKIFHVEQDPRIEEVRAALAGANCGGCGFASQTRNANTSGMVPIERTLDMSAMLAPAEVSSP